MSACTALAVIAWSYVHALTYPGSASWSMRSVEWVRDHGGSGLVNRVENWWYTRNAPPAHGQPSSSILPSTRPTQVAQAGQGPLRIYDAVRSRLTGEGQWVADPYLATRDAPLYTTWFRPDPRHPTVIVGAAWMDQRRTRLALIAGTREPGGSGWPGGAALPTGPSAHILAAFNSGWKLQDQPGGFELGGRTAKPLVAGQASVVIRRDGSVRVGTWGDDLRPGPEVVAVRQNLQLIVERHQPVADLSINRSNRWGSTRNQLQYCWRSGLGLDARGNLVYVGGDQLTLQTLADALVRAGAVTAMELDIHQNMVTFNLYDATSRHRPPRKLLPGMTRPATRYLQPDQRDFFAVTLR